MHPDRHADRQTDRQTDRKTLRSHSTMGVRVMNG